MLDGTFQPSMLRTWIPMAITTVIICMVLSLWSFIIGMIRKSVPATIVTSLIVIVLRQVIITKNTTNQESIMQVILVAIVTVIATLLIFKRKVPELSIFTNGKRKSRRKADSISCIYITAALIFKVNVFSDYTNR